MNRAEKWFSERKKNTKERRRKRGLRNCYEDTERKNSFLREKKETETPW